MIRSRLTWVLFAFYSMRIDFNNFILKHRFLLPFNIIAKSMIDWCALSASIREHLVHGDGWVILDNLPALKSNKVLLHLIEELGEPLQRDKMYRDHTRENDGLISLVTPFSEKGLEARPGQYIYSTSEQKFLMHTDGTAFPYPFDLVLLHCFRADANEQQGLSLLLSVDELIKQLSDEEIGILSEPDFPFYFGLAPILKQNAGHFSIQYNAEELFHFQQQSGIQFSSRQAAALEKLERLLCLEQINTRFTLKPKQCLIINNHRILHGRTALSRRSKRLLKRVRLFWKKKSV
jgi:hypothetical protein